MRRFMLFLLVVSISLLIVGCSDESDEESSGDELVVYTPASEELTSKIVPKFEEETGIKIELVTASTGELLSRIQNESSNPIADVMLVGSPSLIKLLTDNLQYYVSDNDVFLPEAFKHR